MNGHDAPGASENKKEEEMQHTLMAHRFRLCLFKGKRCVRTRPYRAMHRDLLAVSGGTVLEAQHGTSFGSLLRKQGTI